MLYGKDTPIPCARNPTFVQFSCDTYGVQSAFGTVVLVVCAVGVAGAVAALLFGRRTWEDYGRDHLLMEREPLRPATGSAAALVERDEEIRQMLEARNARRRRRGEPELDIEQELDRLTAPAVDDELRAEIRDLVDRAATTVAPGRASRRWTSRPRSSARSPRSATSDRPRRAPDARPAGGRLRAMADPRRVELDDLVNRPGTYFNPQTEVLIVVDDSPELDSEIFNMEEFEGADWVQISDELPMDEHRRDELLEAFQVHLHAGSAEEEDDGGDSSDELEEDDQEAGRE